MDPAAQPLLATAEHDHEADGRVTVVPGNGNKHAEDDDEEAEEMSTATQSRLEESGTASAGAGDEADEEMASRMQRRLDALPGKPHESEPFTIFRVAGPMRDRNRHLYEPQMVSVGPFHRGAARLRAMEEHKWRYLRDLLARGHAPLASYARAARALEPAARRRYAEPTEDLLTPRDFAEMLLLDGCFIVDFFLKGEDGAADALIDAAWAMQNVYSDLFLLENQLPFFVLERFYAIATGGRGRDHLVTSLLAKYLTVETPQDAATARPPDGEILHLLHPTTTGSSHHKTRTTPPLPPAAATRSPRRRRSTSGSPSPWTSACRGCSPRRRSWRTPASRSGPRSPPAVSWT
uniref:Uncharacterized protein n=1 Tax=Aegilops tauschii subsp. strangulata TaxID=200361 RepID=A0A453RNH8_AEGTS